MEVNMSNKLPELTVEEQLKIAEKVISMLMRRAWRDETTDHTGFNISKRKLAEHASKVMKDIEGGALQPTKFKLPKF